MLPGSPDARVFGDGAASRLSGRSLPATPECVLRSEGDLEGANTPSNSRKET
jgi:hypothetical protein